MGGGTWPPPLGARAAVARLPDGLASNEHGLLAALPSAPPTECGWPFDR